MVADFIFHNTIIYEAGILYSMSICFSMQILKCTVLNIYCDLALLDASATNRQTSYNIHLSIFPAQECPIMALISKMTEDKH